MLKIWFCIILCNFPTGPLKSSGWPNVIYIIIIESNWHFLHFNGACLVLILISSRPDTRQTEEKYGDCSLRDGKCLCAGPALQQRCWNVLEFSRNRQAADIYHEMFPGLKYCPKTHPLSFSHSPNFLIQEKCCKRIHSKLNPNGSLNHLQSVLQVNELTINEPNDESHLGDS